MYTQTLKPRLHSLAWLSAMLFFAIASCKKKDNPPQLPTVTTNALTPSGANSATGGGNITSAGNAQIIKAGLCYSSTNQMPTITDDTTVIPVATGSFESVLNNLESSTTYYVRAYATNSVGTGYGEVKEVMTGNAAPEVEVEITGEARVDKLLRALYTYSDAENDAESGTTFQWYRADDASGTGETAITDATDTTYRLQPEDEFKYIRVSVTPKAATGSATGDETKSEYTEAVQEAVTVTFTYNGEEVSYGIITSPVTGKKWLDRNLGALRQATSFTDYQAYGDLFQRGRSADGHQLISWTSSAVGAPVNLTTTTLATSDDAGNSLFITPTAHPFDWRNTQNDLLWQEPDFKNSPCPAGWHIPTNEEWNAENITSLTQVFEQLKITACGERRPDNGMVGSAAGQAGIYWSATVSFSGYGDIYEFSPAPINPNYYNANIKSAGYACRCVQND